MVIVVASGKGGTGKTTFASNLALYLARKQHLCFMDLDVEEPNAHIFFKPEETSQYAVNKLIPEVDLQKCTFCGQCADLCEYNALAVIENDVLVFPELCHSCGVCQHFCPEDAISERDYEIGHIKVADLANIRFLEGNLNVGEITVPEVIHQVKENIVKDGSIYLLDAPPGSSCSVVESVKGTDFCILVTEPTPFGLSDLALMVGVLNKLSVPAGIVINQYQEGQRIIDDYASKENIPILAKIPFDRQIAELYSTGIPFIETLDIYDDIFSGIIPQIEELLAK